MKKPIHIGDGSSMDDAEWEHTRRVLAATSNLAEASNLLEEDTSMIQRRRRRHGDHGRPKRGKPGFDNEMEDLAGD